MITVQITVNDRVMGAKSRTTISHQLLIFQQKESHCIVGIADNMTS